MPSRMSCSLDTTVSASPEPGPLLHRADDEVPHQRTGADDVDPAGVHERQSRPLRTRHGQQLAGGRPHPHGGRHREVDPLGVVGGEGPGLGRDRGDAPGQPDERLRPPRRRRPPARPRAPPRCRPSPPRSRPPSGGRSAGAARSSARSRCRPTVTPRPTASPARTPSTHRRGRRRGRGRRSRRPRRRPWPRGTTAPPPRPRRRPPGSCRSRRTPPAPPPRTRPRWRRPVEADVATNRTAATPRP